MNRPPRKVSVAPWKWIFLPTQNVQNARKRQECPKRYFTAKNVPCQAIFRAFMAFMVLFFPIFQQTAKKVSSSFLIDLSARWYDTFVQCSRAA
jgi:hypothetical protein